MLNLLESRVTLKTGVPLHIAVTYDARTSYHLLGPRAETTVSPNDKKLKLSTEDNTFIHSNPVSLKVEYFI